jgi:hypothetical protein
MVIGKGCLAVGHHFKSDISLPNKEGWPLAPGLGTSRGWHLMSPASKATLVDGHGGTGRSDGLAFSTGEHSAACDVIQLLCAYSQTASCCDLGH